MLEKHYTPGGFTHVFTRPDYAWDVGVHYVGDAHKKGTMINRIFNLLSDGNLEWNDMGDVYDKIIFGNKEYNFVKGVSNFKNEIKKHFPNETEAIDKYINLLIKANTAFGPFMMEKILPEITPQFVSNLLKKMFFEFSDQTTYDVLKSLTDNEELIGVLVGQFGDYGLTPKKSSFGIHALVALSYMRNGGGYPVGGSEAIFESIAPKIIKSGGTIISNAEVVEVLIKDKVAYGVKMNDGREIYSGSIISGIGFNNTFNKIIPNQHRSLFPASKFEALPVSSGHFSLYIGIKESAKTLNLSKTNMWVYPDSYDHDQNHVNYTEDSEQPFPIVYISFPSAKDPDFEKRYPNKSTIELVSFAPYEWFTKWEGSEWKKRGEEYDVFKEQISKRLLDVLYERLPNLRGKIDYYELSTPLSTKHFSNYEKGEIYGIDHTPSRFRSKSARPQTPVKNFYLTGQDILTAGVIPATLSGFLTSSVVLGNNLLNKLFKKSKD